MSDPVASVKQIRELDSCALSKTGIPENLLMEDAALAAFSLMKDYWGVSGKKILIFCGPGNNGGDGLALARKIYAGGGFPTIFLITGISSSRTAASLNYKIVRKIGLPCRILKEKDPERIDFRIYDYIVDAIFGTGLSRDVSGIARTCIDAVNGSGKKIFSLDIPSGINGDTGKILGIAVKADMTLTFGLPKTGNLFYPGAACHGELFRTPLSFSPELIKDLNICTFINNPERIPERNPAGYKGSFGRFLTIGGSGAYYGAPVLAAAAVLKSGGGYSVLASEENVISAVAGSFPELVFVNRDSSFDIRKISEKMKGLIIGPGLSLDNKAEKTLLEVLNDTICPVLIDGDGLTLLSKNKSLLKNKEQIVLTPHAGEMASLLDISIEECLEDPILTVKKASEKYNACVIFKGPRSVIGYPDGSCYINMTGNSGMATPGSGDVLCGTVMGLFGLGFDFFTAARMGVLVHGSAGDLAAADIGPDGITATDILNYLPSAVKKLRETEPYHCIKTVL